MHTGMRRYLDPEAYRIVLFDQRGCGRSTPNAARTLHANTTHHLIGDIERLRRHLGIDSWLVLGASWGTTLGLAYAERFPERVSEMVLFSITNTSRREVEWVTRDMARFFPAQWARFRDGVPEATGAAAWWTRTPGCSMIPIPRCGSGPPGTGARGRTPTSPPIRATGPTPVTTTRRSA